MNNIKIYSPRLTDERKQLLIYDNPPLNKIQVAYMTSFFRKLDELRERENFNNEYGFYNPELDEFPTTPTQNDLLTLTKYLKQNPKMVKRYFNIVKLYGLDAWEKSPKRRAVEYCKRKEQEKLLSIWTRQFYKQKIA